MENNSPQLKERLRMLSRLMASHGGNIELLEIQTDGTAHIKFGGRCRNCPLKPFTLAATVRPALHGIEGINRVEAVGVRLSEYAERRLAAYSDVPSALG